MDRICIWCQRPEGKVSFIREAHIFPQSLGGKRLCSNVCDECNTYFGSKQSKLPSVEVALKEPLNISRMFIMSNNPKYKNRSIPRFKSEYFKYDLKNQVLTPKFQYSRISDFQAMFVRQFKRGVYKIFLEERSESINDAHSSQFDFIREFARRGIGEYPVFYCQPRTPVIYVAEEDLKGPLIRFTEHSEEVMKRFGFYSYFFLTHTLAFPVIRNYEITLENYIKHLQTEFGGLYSRIVPMRQITDLDFTFSYAFSR